MTSANLRQREWDSQEGAKENLRGDSEEGAKGNLRGTLRRGPKKISGGQSVG